VKDMNRNKGFFVYPNPSAGELNVRLENGLEAWGQGGMVEVSVLNTIGKTVWSKHSDAQQGNIKIDLSNQPSGLYIIRISSNDRSVQQKVSLLK